MTQFKVFYLVLKFVYKLRTRVELRTQVIKNELILTPQNAMHDILAQNREAYVTEVLKGLPRYKPSSQDFKDDRKQTFKGMTNLEHGDKYQGCWATKDDGTEIIHGRGIYVYANGSQYVGFLHEGLIVGKGRMIYHNGDIYEGEFEDQKYSGHGKYIYAQTHQISGFYEGKFEDNKITGDGKLKITSIKPLTGVFGKVSI